LSLSRVKPCLWCLELSEKQRKEQHERKERCSRTKERQEKVNNAISFSSWFRLFFERLTDRRDDVLVLLSLPHFRYLLSCRDNSDFQTNEKSFCRQAISDIMIS
jgi:hypothetical protein